MASASAMNSGPPPAGDAHTAPVVPPSSANCTRTGLAALPPPVLSTLLTATSRWRDLHSLRKTCSSLRDAFDSGVGADWHERQAKVCPEGAREGGLHVLDLTRCLLAEHVNPLAGSDRLHTLLLTGTAVADVSGLRSCENLAMVSLRHTKVADIEPLAQLSKLRTLDLQWAPVADLAPLAAGGCAALETLLLRSTRVRDVRPLAKGLPALQTLSLCKTKVTSRGVAALAACPKLRSLDLQWCVGVADVSGLAEPLPCKQLVDLNLFYCAKVASIDCLSKVRSLRQVSCKGTRVTEQAKDALEAAFSGQLKVQ